MQLELLREMLPDRVAPDSITFSAAISTGESDMQWQRAMELLSKVCMAESRQTRSPSAQRLELTRTRLQWKVALDLLREVLLTGSRQTRPR